MSLASPFDGLAAVAMALAAILSALVSLVSSATRREAVTNGLANVQSLCELTGILDPRELQDVFGPPDMGRVWKHVTLEHIYAARRPMGHLISGRAVDWLCILVALLSFFIDHMLIGIGLAMAVSTQIAGWVLAARLPR